MLNLQELNPTELLFVSGGEDHVSFKLTYDKMMSILDENGSEIPFMKTIITIGYSGSRSAFSGMLTENR